MRFQAGTASGTAAADTTADPIDAVLLDALGGEPTREARTAAGEVAARIARLFAGQGHAGPAEQARALAEAFADDAPLAPRALDLSRAAAVVRVTLDDADGAGAAERRAPPPPAVALLGACEADNAAFRAAAAALAVEAAVASDTAAALTLLDAGPAPGGVIVVDGPAAPELSSAALAVGAAVAILGATAGGPGSPWLPHLDPASPPQELVRAALALARYGRADGARVLVATDDTALIEVLTGALGPLGAEVTAHTDAAGADAIVLAPPDAIVADGRGERATSTLALLRELRVREDTTELAVIVLSEAGCDLAPLYAAGADDVLVLPAGPGTLAACVTNRVARCVALRRAGESDPLTGLPREREALSRLESLRGRAAAAGEPFSVAVVAVDDLVRVNTEHGRTVGDALISATARLLETALRTDDVVGRLSGGEFVVGGRGLAAGTAVDRLERLVAHAAALQPVGAPSGTHLRLAAGVAVHSPEGTTALVLAQAAAAALLEARATRGGGRVVLSDDARSEERTTDVLVVDDDRFAAAIVEQTLVGQGLRVEITRDGHAAAEILTRPGGARPGVVLLDWELPGLDGPAVLRRMRDAGTLHETRVIMLTSRSTEQDVLAVMRAGAIDHIPKPFSAPVLVERVRRALVP